MNEYILIYEHSADTKLHSKLDDFFRSVSPNFRRLNDGFPCIVHIKSDLDTEHFTELLQSKPINTGAMLFATSPVIHV